MERLTKRMKNGIACLVDGEHPGDIAIAAMQRLAAYEDKCVAPEDTLSAVEMAKVAYKLTVADAYINTGLEPERVAELAQAERDGRLVVLPPDKARWIKAILAERDRQDQKWGFPQRNTYCEWASILVEEVGELAQELNELTFGLGDCQRMEAEAVQVAAVALSILEQAEVAQEESERAAAFRGKYQAKRGEGENG